MAIDSEQFQQNTPTPSQLGQISRYLSQLQLTLSDSSTLALDLGMFRDPEMCLEALELLVAVATGERELSGLELASLQGMLRLARAAQARRLAMESACEGLYKIQNLINPDPVEAKPLFSGVSGG